MSKMKKINFVDGLGIAGRLVLAAVFFAACIHKIADPMDFGLQVATYQILPLQLINLQAIILPWVELTTAVLLLIGLFTRPAALVTCGMNIMFIIAIAMALNADLHLQCGCFSSSQVGEQMDASLIVRDLGLFMVGVFLVVKTPDRFTLDRLFERKRNE